MSSKPTHLDSQIQPIKRAVEKHLDKSDKKKKKKGAKLCEYTCEFASLCFQL